MSKKQEGGNTHNLVEDEQTYESVVMERNSLSKLLVEIEIMVRVNAPINCGSPMHKSILAALKKYGIKII